MINIALLGSTGSIGRSTLDVVRRHGDLFRVVSLVCGTDADLILRQAHEFNPRMVGVTSPRRGIVGSELPAGCSLVTGPSAQAEAASMAEADVVVAAVSGLAGISGVVAAIEAGKKVALANKESMVACGRYVTALAAARGAEIVPVDSEHSAIYQCLLGAGKGVKRIILTASGGPFYSANSLDELKGITPEQAVRHPNWAMGKKISVDSATMFNKGLEIAEARWLFGTENVDYIIQPDSIVHSMVEFDDGSVMAQLAPPDMKLPIAFALTCPDRIDSGHGQFDFSRPVRFFPPKEDVFAMPAYMKEAMRRGGTLPAALSAADEAAVALFLAGKIAFTDIMRLVEHTLNSEEAAPYNDYRDIIEVHERVVKGIGADYKTILGRGL